MEISGATDPESEPSTDAEPAAFNYVNVIRFLRLAGGAMCAQAAQYGQLASVEWAEEKNRLLHMLVAMMVGFAFLLCTLLLGSALVLLFSWNTDYRAHALIALVSVYVIGIYVAYYRFQVLSARSDQAFSAIREELAADIAIFKSKL